MGWRYRAHLFMIAAVAIIWVTSAEVTQLLDKAISDVKLLQSFDLCSGFTIDRTKYYLLASFVLHIKHSESKDSAISSRILLSGPADSS
ncbi:hypothetical protein ACSBR2_032097 [Camellia fascicularis]